MKQLKPLVMMQLKDKLDLSFLASKKSIINKTVFSLLKFLAVCVVAVAFFLISKMLNLFSIIGELPVSVLTTIMSVILSLTTLSCTVSLMKTLYIATDNKVLITFPVNGNMIFISKLIVYYLFELVRTLTIITPIFIGYGFACSVNPVFYLWVFICSFVIAALPVVIGALLSIPALFIYRFFKRYSLLGTILFTGVIALFVLAIISLINLIPANLNISNSWNTIFWEIQSFLDRMSEIFMPVEQLVLMVMGKQAGMGFDLFSVETLLRFIAAIAVVAIILAAVYFASRPLFFKMMTKSFEFEKGRINKRFRNKKRSSKWSSIRKEFLVVTRSEDIVYNFIAVYVAVPILILLLNKIFAAMDTRLKGQMMVYAFNMLIILLPLLSSNALIATMYSREGAAGYLRKTQPSKAFFPLLSKLALNFVFSLVSILASILVFAGFSSLTTLDTIFLFLSLLLMQYGSMIWAAVTDIMNPQNHEYAHTGNFANNPNETKMTVAAFLVSAIYAVFSYMLFSEGVHSACIKLLLVGILFFTANAMLFYNKIKVYYSEK